MANSPPALAFNSGLAYMVDADTNPTPTNIKILQSASLDMKATTKELYGQNIFPVAVGRAQVKVAGKLKFADYQPRQIRDFIGSTMATGQTLIANAEAGTIPGTPYQVTVSHSATFVLDLGVIFTSTGIPLTEVASSPTTGQYSYAAGVYTFAAADTTLAVQISYTYTASNGSTVTMANTSAGAATSFQTVMGSSYNGLQTNLVLYACVPIGLKVYDTKIGDFSMPELDFNCFVNSAGNLGIVSVPVTS